MNPGRRVNQDQRPHPAPALLQKLVLRHQVGTGAGVVGKLVHAPPEGMMSVGRVCGGSKTSGQRAGNEGEQKVMTERYLESRAALVTGGATGQGHAIALALAARGCEVAIGSRLVGEGRAVPGVHAHLPTREEMDRAVRAIEAQGVRAIGADHDLRSSGSCAALYQATEVAGLGYASQDGDDGRVDAVLCQPCPQEGNNGGRTPKVASRQGAVP